MSATPKCPYCNAKGIDSLAVEDVRLFLVVYCHKCGAIHGVVPKPQSSTEIKVKPAEEPRSNPLIIEVEPQPSPSRDPKRVKNYPGKPPEFESRPVTRPNFSTAGSRQSAERWRRSKSADDS